MPHPLSPPPLPADSDGRLPSAQDLWDTLSAVLVVLGVDPATGHAARWPTLTLPASVVHRLNDPHAALPSQQEGWVALIDTLNTVGYPESFAEQHPTWTVAQGVKRFLDEQSVRASLSEPGYSAFDRWHDLLNGDRSDEVKAWLDTDPDAARQAFIGGKTPLMLAADKDAARCVTTLLPYSDPHATDDLGFNALLFAVRRNAQTSIVRALIPVSDLTVKDSTGRTVVRHLVDNGRVDLLREVLARIDPSKVNVYDRDGGGPLRSAAGESLDLVELMLPHCDPNVPDGDGWTPLMVAASLGKLDIVARLAPVSTLVHAPLSMGLRTFLESRGEGGARALAVLEQEVVRQEQRVLHQVTDEAVDGLDPKPRPRL